MKISKKSTYRISLKQEYLLLKGKHLKVNVNVDQLALASNISAYCPTITHQAASQKTKEKIRKKKLVKYFNEEPRVFLWICVMFGKES